MFEEQSTAEVIKKPENQEGQEVPQSVESPEALRQGMLSESEGETDGFKKAGAEDFSQIEARAASEGLAIDSEDSEALIGLNQEADGARAELVAEIGGESEKRPTPPPLPDAGGVWTPDSKLPPPLPVESRPIPPPLPLEKSLVMKERIIESPDLLSAKEASKKFLVEERKKLAEEIRAQRKSQRDRLFALKNTAENFHISTESMDSGQEDNQCGQLLESQSAEANELAERVSFLELSDQDAQDERNNISQLIQNSENIKASKAKLEEHYAKADAIARERFDTLNRSLEHVIQRNNVFIVHKIEEREELRHNANSNVSAETTYENDVDILLALEPSISASSVTPGEKSKLWPGASGFLLGGGQIGEAGSTDIGTRAGGIKKRGDGKASVEDIDKIVGRQDKLSRQEYERFGSHGMNEVVVNNPEIFGFFQNAERDEDGKFWAYDKNTIEAQSKDMLKNSISRYRERFDIATKRGIPLFVMTPDRNVYECLAVSNDGTIEVGKQLTPEEVATGRAGLPPEKRKEIGERLVEKRIFRKQETQEEAREIIDSL